MSCWIRWHGQNKTKASLHHKKCSRHQRYIWKHCVTVAILTHWRWVMDTCGNRQATNVFENGWRPVRHQTIIKTNNCLLLIRPFRTHFRNIFFTTLKFNWRKWILNVVCKISTMYFLLNLFQWTCNSLPMIFMKSLSTKYGWHWKVIAAYKTRQWFGIAR